MVLSHLLKEGLCERPHGGVAVTFRWAAEQTETKRERGNLFVGCWLGPALPEVDPDVKIWGALFIEEQVSWGRSHAVVTT